MWRKLCAFGLYSGKRLAVLFACGLALAACGGAGGQNGGLYPVLRISQMDLAFGPATLDQAATDFLGPADATAPAAGPAAGGGLGGGLAGGGFAGGGFEADLGLDDLRGREIALGVGFTQPLSADWQMETALRVGQGRIQRDLPPGSLLLGRLVLMADGTLTARTHFAEAEVLALRRMPDILPNTLPDILAGQLALGAGIGARVTHSQMRVTVDTLFAIDARSTHRQTQPFATLHARYTSDKLPARAFVEARVYGRKQAGLRAGLDMVLP